MKNVYTNTPRINCDNCGAVLEEGECPHCGSTWFKPGMTLPNGGMVKSVEITQDNSEEYISGGYKNFPLLRLSFIPTYSITLNIEGMTRDQIQQLYNSLMETELQLFRFQK